MQVVVNKKKIILIVGIVLLVLTVIVASFFFYKKSFSSSRFKDIYTLCEEKVDNGRKIYTCNAFLKEKTGNSIQECFVLKLPSGDSVVEKSLCEKKGVIKWDKEDIDWGDAINSVIPVRVFFSEKIPLPIKGLNIFDISIERVEDKDLASVQNSFYALNTIGNILTYEGQQLEKNGYLPTIVEKRGIGYLYFSKVSLEEITEVDKTLLVKFSAHFKGREKTFTVKTTQFWYSEAYNTNKEESPFKLVNLSNYQNYSKNTNLNMNLIYLPSSSFLLGKDFNTICADETQRVYPACLYSSIMTDITAVEDIEKTLEQVVRDGGYLKSFILLSMNKNNEGD
ncbi:MAG: hypothetical protein ACOX0X_02760 [Candidatus Dojkabacteria bacterium]